MEKIAKTYQKLQMIMASRNVIKKTTVQEDVIAFCDYEISKIVLGEDKDFKTATLKKSPGAGFYIVNVLTKKKYKVVFEQSAVCLYHHSLGTLEKEITLDSVFVKFREILNPGMKPTLVVLDDCESA